MAGIAQCREDDITVPAGGKSGSDSRMNPADDEVLRGKHAHLDAIVSERCLYVRKVPESSPIAKAMHT